MIKAYFIILPVLFIVDILWVGVVAKSFYKQHIGFLMRDNLNWVAVVAFYLVFALGLTLFVIKPALAEKSLSVALSAGALFGLVAYATYDLTNLATLKNWPVLVTIVDLVWGAVLSAGASVLAYLILVR